MRGLLARLALAFSALVLLLLGTVAIYGWFQIGAITRARAEEELLARTQAFAIAVQSSFREGEGLEHLARVWAQESGGRASLFDAQGRLLADSAATPGGFETGAPELRDALSARGLGRGKRLDPLLGKESFYAAAQVSGEGGTSGVVRLTVPIDRLEEGAAPLRRLMLTTTGVTALLGLLLAFVVARYLAAPFRELTRAVESGAVLQQPVYASGSREALELARGLNRLAERVRETMAAVAAEHSRLASLLDNITEAILVTDGAEQVQLLNPAAERLLGVREAEAQGRPLIEVVRDYELAATLRMALATQQTAVREVELEPEHRPLRVVAVPYRVGDSWQAVLLAYDLTEVVKAQRLRREFLANVSHELRTPLAAVHAILEALEMGAMDDPAVARPFLANARAEVQRMSGLVEGLMDLSNIEMGWAHLEVAPTAMGPVLEQAVGTLSVLAAQEGVAVDLLVPEDLPPAPADAQRIHQVVVNLLHNAIKFTPSGGRVTVFARVEGEELLVSVADTGQGIPPEDLPTLFDRFFQGGRPSGRGAGLGLAIVKQIVEAHRGRVWVESAVERGSTFTFSLPLAQDAALGEPGSGDPQGS